MRVVTQDFLCYKMRDILTHFKQEKNKKQREKRVEVSYS
jgi:hypothetical protein